MEVGWWAAVIVRLSILGVVLYLTVDLLVSFILQLFFLHLFDR